MSNNLEIKPLIYSYFELVANEEPNLNNKKITTYLCKTEWCKKRVTISGSTSSNLITHLNSNRHKPEKEDYNSKLQQLDSNKSNPNKRTKRQIDLSETACNSPVKNNLFSMGVSLNVTPAKSKFNRNHPRQNDWLV